MKIDLILPIIIPITPVRVIDHGSCYSEIDSSILQDFFSSVPKCSSCNAEKTLRVDKTKHKSRDKTTNRLINITNKERMNERI